MNISPYQEKLIKWLLVVVVITALAFFGVSFPEVPDFPTPDDASAQGVTNLDSLTLSEDLIVGDDATVTDDLTVSGDTLTFNGETFTATSAITISGVLTDVILIRSEQ